MPIPKSLEALMDHGVVEQVVRPLLSGKEAEVYLVVSEGAYRVAKVYKEAHHRTFRNRAAYTEGRKVRNSRDQRAMAKRTSHGKTKDEAAWRSTEVDMIYKLEAAGVRVPKPYHFVDGILIMELVQTAEGEPAPRLGELQLTAAEAKHVYATLLAEVVRMLCAGVVHGDLSEFNVLLGHSGPCIIDFPQSVHAASNANARKLLLRDVSNLHRFLERFVPNKRSVPYGEEMWELYEKGELKPSTQLTGKYTPSTQAAEVDVVLAIIEEAKRDERMRQQRLGGEARGYGRKKSTALQQSTHQTDHAAGSDERRGHRSGGHGAGQASRGGRGVDGGRSAERGGHGQHAAGRSGDHTPGSYGHHGSHGAGAQVHRDSHAGHTNRRGEGGGRAVGRHGALLGGEQGRSEGPGRDRPSGRGGQRTGGAPGRASEPGFRDSAGAGRTAKETGASHSSRRSRGGTRGPHGGGAGADASDRGRPGGGRNSGQRGNHPSKPRGPR